MFSDHPRHNKQDRKYISKPFSSSFHHFHCSNVLQYVIIPNHFKKCPQINVYQIFSMSWYVYISILRSTSWYIYRNAQQSIFTGGHRPRQFLTPPVNWLGFYSTVPPIHASSLSLSVFSVAVDVLLTCCSYSLTGCRGEPSSPQLMLIARNCSLWRESGYVQALSYAQSH